MVELGFTNAILDGLPSSPCVHLTGHNGEPFKAKNHGFVACMAMVRDWDSLCWEYYEHEQHKHQLKHQQKADAQTLAVAAALMQVAITTPVNLF